MYKQIIHSEADKSVGITRVSDKRMEELMADVEAMTKVQEVQDKWEVVLDKDDKPVYDIDGNPVLLNIGELVWVPKKVTIPGLSESEAFDSILSDSIPVSVSSDTVVDEVTVVAGTLIAKREADAAGIPYTYIYYELVDESDIPEDKTFLDAWEHDTTTGPNKFKTPAGKLRKVAHRLRRRLREELLSPLDKAALDPAKYNEIEVQRQAIRDDNAAMQLAIDAPNPTEAKMKAILGLAQ